MKTEKPLNVVLKDMTLVHKLAKKSGLKPSKLKGSNTAAIRLAEYLGITKKQVYLLSSTFFLNLKQTFVNIMDVGNHFDMDEDDVVCLIPAIVYLHLCQSAGFRDGAGTSDGDFSICS